MPISSLCNVRAVMYDWDGTLVDSMHQKRDRLGQAFQEVFRGDAERARQSYLAHSGLGRRELFQAIAVETLRRRLSDDEYQAVSSRFRELTWKLRAVPFDDVPGQLGVIEQSGIAQFVSSGMPQDELRNAVERTAFAQHFREVLGSQGEFAKGRAHVQYVCDTYGLHAKDIVLVGDDVLDMRAAKEAGVVAIGRAGHRTGRELLAAGADFVVADLIALSDLISSRD